MAHCQDLHMCALAFAALTMIQAMRKQLAQPSQ
jgi:hypothetical protein